MRLKSAANLEIEKDITKKKNFEIVFQLIASSLKKIGLIAHKIDIDKIEDMDKIRNLVITELNIIISKSDSEGWNELSSRCKEWLADLSSNAQKSE